jgi:hypothetical protein
MGEDMFWDIRWSSMDGEVFPQPGSVAANIRITTIRLAVLGLGRQDPDKGVELGKRKLSGGRQLVGGGRGDGVAEDQTVAGQRK